MSDDVEREIREILDKSRKRKDEAATGSVVIGDISGSGNTVIIGNNNTPGRREEDKPGAGDDSHGRRASDQMVHEELRMLRHQVSTLLDMVEGFKKKVSQCHISVGIRHRCSETAGDESLKPHQPAFKEGLQPSNGGRSLSGPNHENGANVSNPRYSRGERIQRRRSPATPRFIPPYPKSTHFISGVSDLMTAHMHPT